MMLNQSKSSTLPFSLLLTRSDHESIFSSKPALQIDPAMAMAWPLQRVMSSQFCLKKSSPESHILHKWTGWFQPIPKTIDHSGSSGFRISMDVVNFDEEKKHGKLSPILLPLYIYIYIYWRNQCNIGRLLPATPCKPRPAPPPPHLARSVDPQPPPAPFPDLLPAAPREGRNERITGMVDLWWIYVTKIKISQISLW